MSRRELHIRPAILLGHMTVTMEGDPRELAGDLFHAMQHNRVLSETLQTAVAMFFAVNNISPLVLLSKVDRIEQMPTFIPPSETQPGSAGKQPGEG